ncbi:phosphatase PAP2 family protein [Mariniflexile ostreae]|uniref:Phosphatase PAP2 family protein n=1 Tax=Mariniflexile ostreae TaxID=1520892 RepID=A0ABV5FFG0_9FLAO
MWLIKSIFLAIAIALGHTSMAQSNDSIKPLDSTLNSTWGLLKQDTNATWKSVKYSVSRPLHWKGSDFKKLGILLGGTASLSLMDEASNSFFTRQHQDVPKIIRDFGWYFGSPQNYFMANAGLYGFGLLTKNEKIRKTSVLIISSSITSGLIQSISKTAFGRARPGTGYSPYEFQFLSNEGTFHSFPSGHTILSVTMAHAIAKQFTNTWTKVAIYSIGAIPPFSRLTINAHWLTDVALSAAISVIVVDSIDKFLNNNRVYDTEQDHSKISWSLAFTPNQIGVIGRF